MYPIILLCVAVSVVGVMMIFVVPVFVEIFGNAGVELPVATQMVMAMSDFLRSSPIKEVSSKKKTPRERAADKKRESKRVRKNRLKY